MRRLAGWRRHRTPSWAPSWVDRYTATFMLDLVLDRRWVNDRGIYE